MRMRPRERLSGGNLRKRDCWRSHVKFERSTGTVRFFLLSLLFPSSPLARTSSTILKVRLLKEARIFRDRWSRLPIERRARRPRRRFLSKMESPAERPSDHLQVHETRSERGRDVRVANGSLARSGSRGGRGGHGTRRHEKPSVFGVTTRRC